MDASRAVSYTHLDVYKRQEEYLAGKGSLQDICEKYNIRSDAQLRNWIQVYRADGMAVFVKDAVTGDVVEAEITKVKKNYAFGNIRKYLKKSEDRTDVLCPYNDRCGGCIYQELNYDCLLYTSRCV